MDRRRFCSTAVFFCHASNCPTNALDTILSLRNENAMLASLRDFLLPMLMNGQVKVADRA